MRKLDLANHRNVQSSSGCIEDTQQLDENIQLQENFDEVLLAFSDSFNETNAWKYCTASKSGQIVSLDCMVDYSSFEASGSYKSQCESLGANIYDVTILMICTSSTNNLQMDLKNIPQCIGKSCDTGHLYLTLLRALNGIQESLGTGDEWDWSCEYFHDFDSLVNAPTTVIEIPEKAAPSPSSQNRAGSNNIISVSTTLSLIAITVFYLL